MTPEVIAKHIASHLVGSRQNTVVLDPFCGCGGNAIAFAGLKEVDLVVCVDKDGQKLKKAAINAQIYGVPDDKMVFIESNAFKVLQCYENGKLNGDVKGASAPTATSENSGYRVGALELLPQRVDTIFLSPPWGGMDYIKVGKRNYTLKSIQIEGEEGTTKDGDDLLAMAAKSIGCFCC